MNRPSGARPVDWERLLDDCVDFTQRLVRTPSMPGGERAVADLVAAECRAVGFDEVALDEVGNVTARMCGAARGGGGSTRGEGTNEDGGDGGAGGDVLGAIVLNSHLDHVDPGDPTLWSVPPYSARIIDGRIVGRATCDIKGPMAVQVYAAAGLPRSGERPRRDVVFSAVVEEEVGGAGAQHWVANVDFPVDLVVLGEPSDNDVAIGHRGILQMWLTFHGRSVHASAPERGRNPNVPLAEFLVRLEAERDRLGRHDMLGATTMTPTIIEVDTTSPNVTPAWARVLLDVRSAIESPNSLAEFVNDLAGDWPHTISDAWAAEPGVPLPDTSEAITGFYTPPDSQAVRRATAAIAAGTGHEPGLIRYGFATDGRFFARLGAPIIGYSPAEEDQAHVADESISIAKMAESLRGHVQLLREY
ncbi:MAG: M20 family metallopeptidase [Anaerolineae bacterium]